MYRSAYRLQGIFRGAVIEEGQPRIDRQVQTLKDPAAATEQLKAARRRHRRAHASCCSPPPGAATRSGAAGQRRAAGAHGAPAPEAGSERAPGAAQGRTRSCTTPSGTGSATADVPGAQRRPHQPGARRDRPAGHRLLEHLLRLPGHGPPGGPLRAGLRGLRGPPRALPPAGRAARPVHAQRPRARRHGARRAGGRRPVRALRWRAPRATAPRTTATPPPGWSTSCSGAPTSRATRCTATSAPTRRRICIYLGSMASNGIMTSALNLLHNLDYDRYDVTAYWAFGQGPGPQPQRPTGRPRVRVIPRAPP